MFAFDRIRDPELRELHDYWLTKHRHGRLPRRSDIDPLEVPRLLKNLALLEVVGDAEDFVFVLAGSRIEEAFDRTLKGVTLGELRKTVGMSPSAEQYVAAVRFLVPQYRQADMREYGKEHWAYRRLILPLSSDGERVDCLLKGAVFSLVGAPDHEAWLGD
jgi:hypothetical protein